MLETLPQNLVFGLLVGALYGLAAMGLSLVFGVTKFLNVSHGELLMYGGYSAFWLFTLLHIDPLVSLPLTILFLILIGYVLYRLLFARMVKLTEDLKIKNTLLIGFGLSIILQNLALRMWSADDQGIAASYAGTALTFLGIRFPIVRLMSLAISVICLVALQLFLQRTYTGKAIRATVENWEASTLMGIDIYRVYLLSFVIGASLAGVAGALVSVSYSINPAIGLEWTLKALIVMVLGGLGSPVGTFLGGLILGVTESATSVFISSDYREVVGLLLFILVLLFRPQGLFGKKEK